ncbi:hypothetical protein MSAS_12540 [Mycobacterium saskatchewanense]|uniref:Ig-like domain-containing protein n=1 Tax=Mycobacterium saskatchewanense TaxID=220927 RepID=A0AAJ3NKE9_9MYCO|nr:DUF6636 domain-containing protein [Mycobacterium saskatchewanense]ORW64211.1 hypothetical protein AWC23_26610 [Mycobacterium saskatchewanense]BBX62080.1 hypothetical protein MSAS_12540 [Mycobacterium saskatchewanense]
MTRTTLYLVLAAVTAAAPATARADSLPFQSPSGNIACVLGNTAAECDVSDYTYQVPPGPACAQHIAWGNRFSLPQGRPAEMQCHGDTLRMPGEQTLEYGQSLSAGTVTCVSEPAGIRCTDASTGHFFRVSRDSYELG